MADNPRIVLTGGPGGGKTTLIRELRAADPRGARWMLVPEAAPLLFQAGLDGRQQSFQRAVVPLQIALEETCAEAAEPQRSSRYVGCAGLAAVQWLEAVLWRDRDEFSRLFWCDSFAVTTIGAEGQYRCWPNAHQPKTIRRMAQFGNVNVFLESEESYALVETAASQIQ